MNYLLLLSEEGTLYTPGLFIFPSVEGTLYTPGFENGAAAAGAGVGVADAAVSSLDEGVLFIVLLNVFAGSS